MRYRNLRSAHIARPSRSLRPPSPWQAPRRSRALRGFQSDAGGAKELLQVAEARDDAKLDATELAALTTVASTLLCMDETITKE